MNMNRKLRITEVATGKLKGELELGGYVAASPAVQGDTAFFGTFDNRVLAVNLTKPEIVWDYTHPKRKYPFYSSAAIAPDRVVIGGRDKLVHALNIATGESVWTYNAGGRVDASPVLSGKRVYVATTAGKLIALDLETGELAWEFELGAGVTASPSVANERLVLGDQDGTIHCFGGNSD